jgi:cytochrome P450
VSHLDGIGSSRLPALLQTLEFAFRPREFTDRNVARFGRTFVMRAPRADVILTAVPEHARRIFGADPDTFETFAAVVLQPFFGVSSVLLQSGPPHRRLRKLMTPPLHGAQLRLFGKQMQTLARARIDALGPGSSLHAHDLTTDFTLDVILRTVFGAREGSEATEYREVISEVLASIAPVIIFAPAVRTQLFPPWRRYCRAVERFDRMVARVLAERRAAPPDARGDDVLSLFINARYDDGSAMSDAEIRDQLVTLLLAGHETTAIALATVLERLHRNPRVLAELRRRIATLGDEPEDIVREPYVGAVLDETMRIAPIVTDVARVVRTPFELEPGRVLPPGAVVGVLMEALHRDPELYPAPAVFRPERFLERKYAPYEYAPFGGGSRRCLGASFSDYEGRIFLVELLKRVELELASAAPSRRVRRNITMGPADGVPIRVLRRLG